MESLSNDAAQSPNARTPDDDTRLDRLLEGRLYRRCRWRECGYWVCVVLSGGIVALLDYWFPFFFLRRRTRSAGPRHADIIAISSPTEQVTGVATISRHQLKRCFRQFLLSEPFHSTVQLVGRSRDESSARSLAANVIEGRMWPEPDFGGFTRVPTEEQREDVVTIFDAEESAGALAASLDLVECLI
eukprot:Polyplicarium_translucidae@DN4585_c0_g1_i1.p1